MRASLHLFILALISLSQPPIAVAQRNGFSHDTVNTPPDGAARDKRLLPLARNVTVTEQCPLPTSTHPSILSIVFPSPDASPVEVTAQSQVVTSYIPEMTWCVGPPVAFIPLTANLTGPPYRNHSMEYMMTVAGTGSCETVYASTTTKVCATTLTGLASKVAVTDCNQQITFSSECGFTLETPTPTSSDFSLITPAPTVKRMMTYWMAPWQSLTRGETPGEVDIKVCTVLGNDEIECIRYKEVWAVVVVTQTVITTRQVNLSTTVSGPGTLLVETMQVFITDTIMTVDLSTVMLLETEIETETTSKGKKLVTRPAHGKTLPTSIVYITKKVKYKSPKPELTTTVHTTTVSTKYVTVTKTRARPQPSLSDFVAPDFHI